MICKPCGIAGDLIKHFRDNDPRAPVQIVSISEGFSFPVATGELFRAAAENLHFAYCPGSTHCDCQHYVDMKGDSVRKEFSSNGQA